jgi:glycosyltransferase involved in cell wall biosynthesis
MRIGIDARPLSDPPGGITRVVTNIVQKLERIDRENLYFLYSDRNFELPFDNLRWHKRVHTLASFVPSNLWLQTEARRMVKQDNLDIFWAPAHILPVGLPAKIRKILTVHDLVWKRYPETMEWRNSIVHRLFAERSVREADRITADSVSTKRDLKLLLGVRSTKIEVVHLGVSSHFRPHDPAVAAQRIARKFGVSEKYICAVGTVEPRKNLAALVEAIGILKKQGKLTHQLVVAGGKGWGKSKASEWIRNRELTEDDVRFLGFIPEEDLPLLYSGAAMFVFPSIYEGFGLPLLEAMACGAPVASSNRSSLPEVAGDSGLYFDPASVDEIASTIDRALSEPDLRTELAKQGAERARQFTWEACARIILGVFETEAKERH